MMKTFELQVDFFIPLWRRVAVTVVCLGWSAFEFSTMEPLWGIVFGGMGVYALWQFFLTGWPETDRATENLNTEKHDDDNTQ